MEEEPSGFPLHLQSENSVKIRFTDFHAVWLLGKMYSPNCLIYYE